MEVESLKQEIKLDIIDKYKHKVEEMKQGKQSIEELYNEFKKELDINKDLSASEKGELSNLFGKRMINDIDFKRFYNNDKKEFLEKYQGDDKEKLELKIAFEMDREQGLPPM